MTCYEANKPIFVRPELCVLPSLLIRSAGQITMLNHFLKMQTFQVSPSHWKPLCKVWRIVQTCASQYTYSKNHTSYFMKTFFIAHINVFPIWCIKSLHIMIFHGNILPHKPMVVVNVETGNQLLCWFEIKSDEYQTHPSSIDCYKTD